MLKILILLLSFPKIILATNGCNIQLGLLRYEETLKMRCVETTLRRRMR